MWKLRALLFSAPAIVLATIAMGTISMICSLWDRAGSTQHRVARVWSHILLACGFIRCEAYGIEKLDPNRSYVLVSNHASYMDTPAVLSAVPLQFRFFAKNGLFSIPFLGWHLRRAGHLPVVRDDPRASIKAMSEGARLIAEHGVSLLLFPEGGRSEQRLQPFKEGAAYIAIKAQVPAVPIGLVNTRRILPMHSAMVRSGTIELHVGDPIDTTGMKLHDRARLTEMLQERVGELVGETVEQTRS
ncbi:MAG: lysophospholipid acyltransferase family protein [Bryobacteraceae bacterium]|jgi:1-acyl-sn-glycerol-3-phosphate acyltransferase